MSIVVVKAQASLVPGLICSLELAGLGKLRRAPRFSLLHFNVILINLTFSTGEARRFCVA